MQSIRALTQEPDIDVDLAGHVYDKQIVPQMQAAAFRARGIDVGTAFVSTAADAEGFEVECSGCGRKAKVPVDPKGQPMTCPDCVRRVTQK